MRRLAGVLGLTTVCACGPGVASPGNDDDDDAGASTEAAATSTSTTGPRPGTSTTTRGTTGTTAAPGSTGGPEGCVLRDEMARDCCELPIPCEVAVHDCIDGGPVECGLEPNPTGPIISIPSGQCVVEALRAGQPAQVEHRDQGGYAGFIQTFFVIDATTVVTRTQQWIDFGQEAAWETCSLRDDAVLALCAAEQDAAALGQCLNELVRDCGQPPATCPGT